MILQSFPNFLAIVYKLVLYYKSSVIPNNPSLFLSQATDCGVAMRDEADIGFTIIVIADDAGEREEEDNIVYRGY